MTRLRAIYGGEGKKKISVAVSKANAAREQLPTLVVSNNVGDAPKDKPEFNIEEAYEAATERTAKKEPQPKPESNRRQRRRARSVSRLTGLPPRGAFS